MKWFASFLCMMLLASIMCAVPIGCESNKATKIDTSNMEEDENDAAGEEDYGGEDGGGDEEGAG